VGRGAALGWEKVLLAAVATRRVSLWPFDGSLQELLTQRGCVVAETYPAEFYQQLAEAVGVLGAKVTGKRKHASRLAYVRVLETWFRMAPVDTDDDMKSLVKNGFDDTSVAEDQFDATVGCLGMLNLVLGLRLPYEPPAGVPRAIEGWILGLRSSQTTVEGTMWTSDHPVDHTT
jgi:hypothetical protein